MVNKKGIMYIYSSLNFSVDFPVGQKNGVDTYVRINSSADEDVLLSDKGAAITNLHDDDYAAIKDHIQFQSWEKAGHIVVMNKKLDGDGRMALMNDDMQLQTPQDGGLLKSTDIDKKFNNKKNVEVKEMK